MAIEIDLPPFRGKMAEPMGQLEHGLESRLRDGDLSPDAKELSAAREAAGGRRRLLLAGVGSVVLVALWSPALGVAFWQDDYGFLLAARDARWQGRPWYESFWSGSPDVFWRPLSVNFYWRFIEGVCGGNPIAAHAFNIALLLLAAAAVGWLAAGLLRIRAPKTDAALGGLAAAFLYGIHGSHFLPAAWASGVQDSFLVLFSALALRGWLTACSGAGLPANLAGATGIGCFAMALLSKENAAVVPLWQLVLMVWLWPNRHAWRRPLGWTLSFLALLAAWWIVHHAHTLPPQGPYAIKLGVNVPRNAVNLGLFLLNVPREAVRFLVVDRSAAAGAWGVACATLQIVGCGLWLWSGRRQLARQDVAALAVMALVGLGPCLLPAWNCYEYYTSMALVACAVLMGLSVRRTKAVGAALLLLIASSVLSTQGNYRLGYPALVARAQWGRRQLEIIGQRRAADPAAFRSPLGVSVQDEHKFASFGAAGLAYTLGMHGEDVVVLGADQAGHGRAPMLVVPSSGDVYFSSQ
jgi:hypothetical protein